MRLKSSRVLGEGGELRPAVVTVEGSQIAAIESGASDGTWDLGDLLVLPGMIDLHGDAFERQWMPRSGVFFPLDIALLDSDRQLLANGITTAYHGLTVSWEPGLRGIEHGRLMVNALAAIQDRLRCDTRLHLRYELFALDEAEELTGWIRDGRVHLIGFNDHLEVTAQLEQETKMAQYAERSGLTMGAFRELMSKTRERSSEVWPAVEAIAAAARERGLPMASHDDETPEMRYRFEQVGSGICEFPFDERTARSAIEAGQSVVLGGPNLVRGKSHTRRLNAREAIEQGLGTVLTSDYYYPSMLHGVMRLIRERTLPFGAAWDLAAANAAKAAGLSDRGTIRAGLRADFVVVDDRDPALPQVAAVICRGQVVHLADPAIWKS